MSYSVTEKPLMLSELIPLLQHHLSQHGDAKIIVGCHGEGISGDPTIRRDDHRDGGELIFDFHWVEADDADVVVWGEVG